MPMKLAADPTGSSDPCRLDHRDWSVRWIANETYEAFSDAAVISILPSIVTANRRVALLEMPRLLRDILEHAVRTQDKFDLCDEADAAQREPEAVIIAAAELSMTRMDAIRAMWPNTMILRIDPRGGAVFLLAPRLPAVVLGRQSAQDLLAALDRATS
jgi:hypothetical protein